MAAGLENVALKVESISSQFDEASLDAFLFVRRGKYRVTSCVRQATAALDLGVAAYDAFQVIALCK